MDMLTRNQELLTDFCMFLELRVQTKNIVLLQHMLLDVLQHKNETLTAFKAHGASLVVVVPLDNPQPAHRARAAELLHKTRWCTSTHAAQVAFDYLLAHVATNNLGMLWRMFRDFCCRSETTLAAFVARGVAAVSIVPYEPAHVLYAAAAANARHNQHIQRQLQVQRQQQLYQQHLQRQHQQQGQQQQQQQLANDVAPPPSPLSLPAQLPASAPVTPEPSVFAPAATPTHERAKRLAATRSTAQQHPSDALSTRKPIGRKRAATAAAAPASASAVVEPTSYGTRWKRKRADDALADATAVALAEATAAPVTTQTHRYPKRRRVHAASAERLLQQTDALADKAIVDRTIRTTLQHMQARTTCSAAKVIAKATATKTTKTSVWKASEVEEEEDKAPPSVAESMPNGDAVAAASAADDAATATTTTTIHEALDASSRKDDDDGNDNAARIEAIDASAEVAMPNVDSDASLASPQPPTTTGAFDTNSNAVDVAPSTDSGIEQLEAPADAVAASPLSCPLQLQSQSHPVPVAMPFDGACSSPRQSPHTRILKALATATTALANAPTTTTAAVAVSSDTPRTSKSSTSDANVAVPNDEMDSASIAVDMNSDVANDDDNNSDAASEAASDVAGLVDDAATTAATTGLQLPLLLDAPTVDKDDDDDSSSSAARTTCAPPTDAARESLALPAVAIASLSSPLLQLQLAPLQPAPVDVVAQSPLRSPRMRILAALAAAAAANITASFNAATAATAATTFNEPLEAPARSVDDDDDAEAGTTATTTAAAAAWIEAIEAPAELDVYAINNDDNGDSTSADGTAIGTAPATAELLERTAVAVAAPPAPLSSLSSPASPLHSSVRSQSPPRSPRTRILAAIAAGATTGTGAVATTINATAALAAASRSNTVGPHQPPLRQPPLWSADDLAALVDAVGAKLRAVEATEPWRQLYRNVPLPFNEHCAPLVAEKLRLFWHRCGRAVWERNFWAPHAQSAAAEDVDALAARKTRQRTACATFDAIVASIHRSVGIDVLVALDRDDAAPHPGWWYRQPVVDVVTLCRLVGQDAAFAYVDAQTQRRFPDCGFPLPLKTGRCTTPTPKRRAVWSRVGRSAAIALELAQFKKKRNALQLQDVCESPSGASQSQNESQCADSTADATVGAAAVAADAEDVRLVEEMVQSSEEHAAGETTAASAVDTAGSCQATGATMACPAVAAANATVTAAVADAAAAAAGLARAMPAERFAAFKHQLDQQSKELCKRK